MTEKHEEMRYECSEKMKDFPPEWWEDVGTSDEKIWTTNGMINPQNDRVRAQSSAEVEPLDLEKFPGQTMAWMGATAKGITGIHWLTGKVNG